MSSRLRVIAGPNGAGKSSVFEKVKGYKERGKVISTGPFVNSDQIEKTFREQGFIRLSDYGIQSFEQTIVDDYLRISTLKPPYEPGIVKKAIIVDKDCFRLKEEGSSPYLGMVVSDLIREELLKNGTSFTMETVFSHNDKVKFMERARESGYKVYLYFVSTESPEINIKRVEGRVAAGGHDVPTKKIVERYERTMMNLRPALKIAYRAYLFDNSGSQTIQIGERFTDGTIYLEEKVPNWILKYLQTE